MQVISGGGRRDPKRIALASAVMALSASCVTTQTRSGVEPWCSPTHRSTEGAIEIPEAQVFRVERERLPTAIRRLRERTFVPLTDGEARKLVAGWQAVAGQRPYLVRGGVVTGAVVRGDEYYEVARHSQLFGMWHPRDRHLEVVTGQLIVAPPVYNNLPLVVRTEHEVASASVVCYVAPLHG